MVFYFLFLYVFVIVLGCVHLMDWISLPFICMNPFRAQFSLAKCCRISGCCHLFNIFPSGFCGIFPLLVLWWLVYFYTVYIVSGLEYPTFSVDLKSVGLSIDQVILLYTPGYMGYTYYDYF